MTVTADRELAFAGPGALAALVRAGQVHPRELVELCLRRIEAIDPRTNAFRVTMPEEALAQADAAPDSPDGPLAGVLAGVPIAVKDDTPVAGQAMTLGVKGHGPSDRSGLERSTRQMAGAGRVLVPPRRRARLVSGRATTTARLGRLWDEFDVLMTPGLGKTAIAAEGAFGRSAPIAIDLAGRFTPFTPIFNVTGQPAVTLPAGVGGEGLPLSIQLVGRVGAEDVLYSLAGQIESAAPWASRRPPLSWV